MVNEETARPYDATEAPVHDSPGETTADERTYAMLAHLLAIFVGFIGPLVIWLVKKDESEFVSEQAKESLNFQITVMLAFLACIPLMFIVIGILLAPVIGIAALALEIIASIKAYEGENYRYPFTLRLI